MYIIILLQIMYIGTVLSLVAFGQICCNVTLNSDFWLHISMVSGVGFQDIALSDYLMLVKVALLI